MNNGAKFSSFCRSRREEALADSRIDQLPSAALRIADCGLRIISSRFNASTLQRFNLVLALALLFFGFSSFAQTISPANLPLYFESNHNQTEFLSSGNGCQFAISASGVRMTLRDSKERVATAQMRFVGANSAAQIAGGGEMSGKVNYLIGNDSSKWQTGLPTFANVQVTQLYPGINMVFHGNQRQLEYDFAIAPGANPNAVKMRFDGVDNISVSPEGDLILKIGTHEIRQPKPEVYQTIAGARKDIAGGYKILDSRTVAFEVGKYDHTLPLVIDPVLGFSMFLGSSFTDLGLAIAVDTSDNIYIAGQTISKGFATAGAAQTNFGGGTFTGDAFVAEFSNPTNLVYLTYLGGNADDAAYGIAADGSGHAFITGATESPNFPTNNPIPGHSKIEQGPTGEYLADAFVTELGPGGSNLVYSTYLGGNSADAGYSIALDSSDNAYVTGFSYSTNFPCTSNAIQRTFGGTNTTIFLNANAFVSEITNGGGALVYSTYLGGTNYDVGRAITVDTGGNVYVAGYTASFNFPTWNTPTNLPGGHYLNGITNVFLSADNYGSDAFVTKFPPLNGTNSPAFQTNQFYSTFLGGTNSDMAFGVAADAAGNAYVTGFTSSTNFPVINAPTNLPSFLITNGIPGPIMTNVFLTKISPNGNGSVIANSVVFGGNLMDIGYGVAVDPAGDVFVVGTETSYTNFPTVNGFGTLSTTNTSPIVGTHDAFVTGISVNWSNVFYSVCLGGTYDTYGNGIALDDATTNVYITGATASTNYPTSNTGRFWFNGTNFINGTNYLNGVNFTGYTDAFVSEIVFAPTPVQISAITVTPTNQTVGMGITVTFSVNATGANGQVQYQWQKNGVNLVNGGRISGVNSSTLTITNAQTSDSSTNYGLVVGYSGVMYSDFYTNSYTNSTFTQSNVQLTVSFYPVITTYLTNQTVFAGTNVSFSVEASGSPLTYQWTTNGQTFITNSSHYSGITSNTLTIYNVQTNDAHTYEVVIAYPNGLITGDNSYDSAVLTVVEPLSIISAPTNETVSAGSTVSFSVVATGFPLNYNWSTNGSSTNFITSGGDVSNSFTSSTLTITNVQPADAGTYTVFVNNSLQTNEASAVLTVDTDPKFSSFASPHSGTNGMVFSGAGGTTNGIYYVLTSTNLMTWTPIATNHFNSMGQFIFTNPVPTNAVQQFFKLEQP